MHSQCEPEYETGKTACCPCECHAAGVSGCPGCAQMHGSNPVEMAVMMWRKAFFTAHMEYMVEKLKVKIDEAWGPMADKAADAVIETMGKHWQAMLLQSGAEKELSEKLERIMSEAQRQ